MAVAVSALIVNYNGGQLLAQCLTALREASGTHVIETVVVDNGSTDDSVDSLPPDLQPTVLIRAGENLGFARANNLAAERARGRYWLLINTDCTLHPGQLDPLIRRLISEPRAAIAAPRLMNADGTLQRSCHNFPNPLVLFLEQSTLWRFVRGRRFGSVLSFAADHNRAEPVPWVTAACWLVRPAAWRELGGFDPGFFFYWEEADLCYRLRRRGWQVWFEPAAEATHLGGSSSDVALLLPHFFRGLYRFYHRNYPAAAVYPLRAVVATMAAYKALRSTVQAHRASTSSARSRARAAARAWLTVLRS